MKKIAFVTLGNIEQIATMKRALGLANPLLNLGWSVSIIVMDCAANRSRIELECDKQIQIFYYKEAKSITHEVNVKTQIIREINPDVIYLCSFGFRNRIIKSQLKTKCKFIVEHSELTSSIKDASYLKRFSYYFMEVYSIFYSDSLLCASKYLENYYTNLKYRFLTNSTDIGYFPYAFGPNLKLETIIEKENNETPKIKLLYMGSLVRNYGLFTMLEAVKILSTKSYNFKFFFLGKGDLESAKKFVIENNISDFVQFLGYVPEDTLNKYLNSAQIFVAPLNNTVQDWARCPSKLYMYLPYAKPVFTCKIGESIEIFGDKGYYFDNDCPQSLVNLFEKYLISPIKMIDFDVESHSWERRAKQLLEFIKNIS